MMCGTDEEDECGSQEKDGAHDDEGAEMAKFLETYIEDLNCPVRETTEEEKQNRTRECCSGM
jgi:hypothetical protein